MARKRAKTPNQQLISETLDPPKTSFTGLDRINAIPDHSKKVKENFLEDTFLEYNLMTQKQLAEAAKDKNLTVLERQIITQLVTSINQGKNTLQAGQLSQDRIAGKSRNRVEHSGPNGAPIALSQAEADAKFDEQLAKMSASDLAKYEKAMLILSKLRE